MSQMVYVLQKDCRHLWPAIGTVLLLTALHAYGDATSEGSRAVAVGLSPFTLLYLLVALSGTLLPFALLLLVASVVQEEAAVGTEQFWLTRPYDRFNLVAEKLVFLALFASLPLLLHDIAVLLYLHFPLRAASSLLLWKQAQLWVFLLIAATLAAMTRTLAQFALASIGTVALGLLLLYISTASSQKPFLIDPHSTVYVGLSLLLLFGVAGIILILYQYFRRRTRLSAAIAIGFLGAGLMIAAFWPERLTLYLERRIASAELTNLHLRPDPELKCTGDSLFEFSGDRDEQSRDLIFFPFEATGLPNDVGVVLTTSSAKFKSPRHQAISVWSPKSARFEPAGEADRFFDRTDGYGPNRFISFTAENSQGLKNVADTEGSLQGQLFLDGYRASRLSLDLSPDPVSQQALNIGQEHCLLTSVVRAEKIQVTLECAGLEPGRVSRLGARRGLQYSSSEEPTGPGTWPSFFTPVNRITASFQFENLPSEKGEQSAVASNRRLDIYLEEAVGRVIRDFRIEHLRPAEYDIPAWEQRGVQFPAVRPSTVGPRQ